MSSTTQRTERPLAAPLAERVLRAIRTCNDSVKAPTPEGLRVMATKYGRGREAWYGLEVYDGEKPYMGWGRASRFPYPDDRSPTEAVISFEEALSYCTWLNSERAAG